jgi:hypothetical protein
MDAFVGKYIYESFVKSKEPFEETKTEPEPKSTVGWIISLVMSALISIGAVYLSWSCNTASGMGTGLKIVFAIFAFIFGFLYLIFYLIFRAGRCSPTVVYVQAPVAAAVAPVAPVAPAAAPVVPAQVGGKRRGLKLKKKY